jgi:hypothetical protein
MKIHSKLFISAIAVVLTLGVFTNVCDASEEKTFTGEIWAQTWDDKNMVNSATIATQDGEEYWIDKNAVGKELFKLDMQIVKANGVLSKTADGITVVTISKYELVPITKETGN